MKIGANLHTYKTENFSDRFSQENKSFIRDIDPQDAQKHIDKIKADIKNNWQLTESGSDDVFLWNKKAAASWEVADLVSETAAEVIEGESDNQFTACFINEEVIGVMAWTQEPGIPGLYISSIFSHPGARGAGTALMEHLVNMSEYFGEKGIINLDVMDIDAASVYAKLGFTASGSVLDMQLRPESASDIWKKTSNGEWKFTG
ncbi:GNAT superfamily N-acetyltransferase [Pantoea alhagi]|uniref:GNAT family N-acetyltransferase n=1 Tax=Mixta sp. BE291 TaxID=3158787 RepID=UPI00285733F3|nr:GNAT superfamily N-acetyltransferase [Pantoea alhagi]